jgi:DNA-3-methyladenine glycosylase
MKVLPQSFYARPTERVARELLGKTLCVRVHVRGRETVLRSRIVETEAYLGERDRACHSFGGRRTPRNESLYLPAGFSYVYFIYGMYFCLNAVTVDEGVPEAVLIRAVEPFEDLENPPERKRTKTALPTNGPGKLCRHYGIARDHDGLKLFSKSSRLWIEDEDPRWSEPHSPVAAKRVGIDYAREAKDWDLRFYLSKSPYVSRREKGELTRR